MNSRIQIMFACAAVAMTGCVAVQASEEKVPLDKAPAVIQTAVKKVVGSATMSGLTKEMEHGKTTFEVEYTVGETAHSATIAQDGSLLEEETDLKPAEIPIAIAAALAKELPAGKVGDVSMVTAQGKRFYEADVVVGKEKHELKLSETGAILSNTIETEEEAENEDKK